MPTIHIVAGPNGAGKTTFARSYLPASGCQNFLNADLIAAGLSPLSPATGAVRAARILLEQWDEMLAAGATFGFETTLSGRAYAERLQKARELGYQIHLYYLWLPSVSVALRRIRQRVSKGGHDVPAGDVKRRFLPSLKHFFDMYLPLVDKAVIFDGSTRPPKVVAEIQKAGHTVFNGKLYERIQKAIQAR